MAEIKIELVGRGDVIVITSPDLPKSLVLSDVQFYDISIELVKQAQGHPTSMLKRIWFKQDR